MTKQAVGIVIGRAVVDEKYRQLLKKQPQSAFSGYELSGDERQALAGIDHHALDKLADSVGKRLRSWYVGWAIER